MTTCKPLMSALKRVGITIGGEDAMTDSAVLPATAQASAEVTNLQETYDGLLTRFTEDHELVKNSHESLEKARKQSNATAQLVDEKHATEALIQTNKFLATTTETLAKGDKLERDRLAELKKAVEEQEAFIAQRATSCATFLHTVSATIAQLECMKMHLQAKSQPSEPLAATPAVAEPGTLGATLPNVDKMAEFHTLLAAAKLPTEVEAKLRESADSVFQAATPTTVYSKTAVSVSPAANAAQIGPYQQTGAANSKTEAVQPVTEDHK